jgi:hypothetical protein
MEFLSCTERSQIFSGLTLCCPRVGGSDVGTGGHGTEVTSQTPESISDCGRNSLSVTCLRFCCV